MLFCGKVGHNLRCKSPKGVNVNSPTCNVGNPCQLTTLSPKGLRQSLRDCLRPLGPIDPCPFQSVGCTYGYCCSPPIGEPNSSQRQPEVPESLLPGFGEPKRSITSTLIPLFIDQNQARWPTTRQTLSPFWGNSCRCVCSLRDAVDNSGARSACPRFHRIDSNEH